jgi:hypothetical protein
MNDLDFGSSFSGNFEKVFVFDLGLAGDVLELTFAVPGVLLAGEFDCKPLARAAEDEDRSFFSFIFFLFSLSTGTPSLILFGYE